MDDKERTNYFRKKLNNLRESAEPIIVNKPDTQPPDNLSEKNEKKALFVLFRFIYTYLAFYGSQYIIINKFINPKLVLNFFETGVIFIFLSLTLKNRS